MNTTTKKAANSIVGKLTAGILATAAVAAATTLGALPTPAAALQGGGDSVLVIGDSLEVGSGPHLREALPGMSLEIDADRGRSSGQGAIVLAERLGPEHDVVVFPLGTNDSPSNPAGLAASLAAAAELAGDRCLVIATLARPPLRGVSVAGLNRVVEQFAAETGAQVMDWAAVVDALPSLLASDAVHATGEGYTLRAGLLAEAVQGCGGGGSDLSGLPAPRNPNAKPPPRLPAGSQSAALSVPRPLASLLGRAVSVVAAATRAAVTATRKPTREPVLGAP